MPTTIETVVVGVHLERTGGTVITGERRETKESDEDAEGTLRLAPKSLDKVFWAQDSKEDAAERVRELAQRAAKIGGSKLYSIGVSGPGPFQSLRRRDIPNGDFGHIHPKRSHLPLQGLNIYSIFKSEIDALGASPKADVVVHTDAVACAIGESIIRKTKKRTMLAFFIIGDGIGMGVVRGRSPLRSALHPEIGLLEVRTHPEEGGPFSIKNYDKAKTSYSVAQMASNIALRERCNSNSKSLMEAFASLAAADQHHILERRAYYLAQMCLACTVTLAPHQIVLGQDVELEDDLAGRVWKHFDILIKGRGAADQPLFEYAELGQSDYISNARIADRISESRSLGTTGALGMIHAALVADKNKDGEFRPELD